MDALSSFSRRLELRDQARDNRRLSARRQQRKITRLAQCLCAVSKEAPRVRPQLTHAVLLNNFTLAWRDLNAHKNKDVTNPIILIELRSHIATLLYVITSVGIISDAGYLSALSCLDERINHLLQGFIHRHGATIALSVRPNPSDATYPDKTIRNSADHRSVESETQHDGWQRIANSLPWLH